MAAPQWIITYDSTTYPYNTTSSTSYTISYNAQWQGETIPYVPFFPTANDEAIQEGITDDEAILEEDT